MGGCGLGGGREDKHMVTHGKFNNDYKHTWNCEKKRRIIPIIFKLVQNYKQSWFVMLLNHCIPAPRSSFRNPSKVYKYWKY